MSEQLSFGPDVSAQIDGPRALVRLVRAASPVNALSLAALDALTDAARALARRPEIAVVTLAGRPGAFCGGFDLRDPAVAAMADGDDPAIAERVAQAGGDTVAAWARVPGATVAAIDGYALGGGLMLALACDFRIAAADARLGLPEIDRGVVAGWGGLPRLVAVAGLQTARRLALIGEPADAAAAAATGLLDAVAPPGESALDRAAPWVESLAAKPPAALRATKRLLNAAPETADLDAFLLSGQGAAFRATLAAFRRPTQG